MEIRPQGNGGMNDTETQITMGLVELAMLQHLKNATSMRKQLEAMVHEGRGVAMVSLSQYGDMKFTNVSEDELGGVA